MSAIVLPFSAVRPNVPGIAWQRHLRRALGWCLLACSGAMLFSAEAAPEITGIYRPYSSNVGGRATALRGLGTPLILRADGTYVYGTTTGKFSVDGGLITFSGMRLHPTGRRVDAKIVFEYESGGLQHTLTYLRYGPVPEDKNTPTVPAEKNRRTDTPEP